MLTVSLLVNLMVLATLPATLAARLFVSVPVFGRATDARRVRGCIHAAIPLASLFGLVLIARGKKDTATDLGLTLLSRLIVSGPITPPTVSRAHPVVRTDLATLGAGL